jgi:hypothetical protein
MCLAPALDTDAVKPHLAHELPARPGKSSDLGGCGKAFAAELGGSLSGRSMLLSGWPRHGSNPAVMARMAAFAPRSQACPFTPFCALPSESYGER